MKLDPNMVKETMYPNADRAKTRVRVAFQLPCTHRTGEKER